MIAWIKRFFGPLDFEDEDLATVAEGSYTARYAWFGGILGLFFPLLATVTLLWSNALPLRISSLVALSISEPLLWIIYTAPFVLAAMAALAGRREDRLRKAYIQLDQEKQETIQLQQLTRQLEQQAAQLNISARISQQLSVILDLDVLLAEVVNQVKDGFDYYHIHIYLLDNNEQKLVMAAGTGAAGKEMKANRHSIPLNAAVSLVARSARNKEIIRVDNVRESKDWLPNPLLPDTYAETAVPIILDGNLVGVLDVQEDKIAGLDEADAGLLGPVASQVAVAIRNARLFNQVQTALAEANAAQERYLEQTWAKAKVTPKARQYLYSQPTAPLLDEESQQHLVKAQQKVIGQNQAIFVADDDGIAGASVVAPVMFRDKAIGVLQLHTTDKGKSWTEDDRAMLEAIAEQFAQSAENLRLFDETRQRAEREQTIREITDKMRGAVSLDELVKIAAEELGERFSAGHTLLKLGSKQKRQKSTNGDSGSS